MAAPYSEVTKTYWVQWESFELKDGVLYRLWETPAGDKDREIADPPQEAET